MNNLNMNDLVSYIQLNSILEEDARKEYYKYCDQFKKYGGDEEIFDRLEEKILMYKLRKEYAIELLNNNQLYNEINSVIDSYIVKREKTK